MRIAKVLLAAGQSSRFDGCKLIANVGNNKTMIARAVDVLQQLDAGAVYVVSGAWHYEITQALKHSTRFVRQREDRSQRLIAGGFHRRWTSCCHAQLQRARQRPPQRILKTRPIENYSRQDGRLHQPLRR